MRGEDRRGRLLARTQAMLQRHGAPRVEMGLMLSLSGAAAFGASALLLRFGVGAMWMRYPLTVLAGYAVFLVLLRIWIALHRRGSAEEEDAELDLDFSEGSCGSDGEPSTVGGTGDPEYAHAAGDSGGSSGGGGFSVDADDAVFVLVILAVLLGVVVALGFVIAEAPVLLAELLLDGAIVSGLYKRLGPLAETLWLERAVSRTWKPLAAIVVLVACLGGALQWAAPGEATAGAALRAWWSDES